MRLGGLGLTLGLASLLCAGCGKDAPKASDTAPASAAKAGAKSDAPASKAPATTAAKAGAADLWAGLDLSAELKRLEGKWTVKSSMGAPDTWDIKGDKITVTTGKGETKLGTVKLDMPGRVGIKEPSMTSYYSYTRNGDDLYVGLGRAGVKLGDRYLVSTSRGLVRFDGKACTYHEKKMSFGDKPIAFKDPIEVKCSLQAAADKAVLNYQVPKFMKEGEFDDKSINVVGDALLDQQMSGNKAVKAE